jgi:hypothetical protein
LHPGSSFPPQGDCDEGDEQQDDDGEDRDRQHNRSIVPRLFEGADVMRVSCSSPGQMRCAAARFRATCRDDVVALGGV